MPGIHDRVVRQREQFLMNRIAQVVKAAVREIRTPDAAGKQHVAAEYAPWLHLLTNEHDVPNRVTWRFEHIELDASRPELPAFAQHSISRRASERKTERCLEIQVRVG